MFCTTNYLPVTDCNLFDQHKTAGLSSKSDDQPKSLVQNIVVSIFLTNL